MASTKVPIELSSTPSIVDNGNATAITIDSSENVGIGTSPTQKLDVNGTAVVNQLNINSASYDNRQLGMDSNGFFIYNSADASYDMVISDTGNVGIGTSSPTAKLSVELASNDHTSIGNTVSIRGPNGTGLATGAHYDGSGAGTTFVSIGYSSTQGGYRFYSANGSYGSISERLKIDSSGYLYNPSMLGAASANSDVRFNTSDGLIYYQTSSRRYKENIQDLPSMLDKVNALRAVTFDEIATGESCYGLIAEEVFEQIPELVNLKEVEGYDTPQPDNIPYSMLSVFLLKAMQEQQTIIEDLKARITTLEGN